MRNWHPFQLRELADFTLPTRRTLPMRNWHQRYQMTPLMFPHWVGHYLWGIDTQLQAEWDSPDQSSRTLPMRNWHKYFIDAWIVWKPQIVGHYLWGIDTSYRRKWKSLILIFFVGHYLWGIDTTIINKIVFCKFTIQYVGHYLWGIDTFRNFL